MTHMLIVQTRAAARLTTCSAKGLGLPGRHNRSRQAAAAAAGRAPQSYLRQPERNRRCCPAYHAGQFGPIFECRGDPQSQLFLGSVTAGRELVGEQPHLNRQAGRISGACLPDRFVQIREPLHAGSSAANNPESSAAPISCRSRQRSCKPLVIDLSSRLATRSARSRDQWRRSVTELRQSVDRPARRSRSRPATDLDARDKFTEGCRSFGAAKLGRDGPAGKAVGLRCSPSAPSCGGGRRPLDAHRVIVALSWHAPSCRISGPLIHTSSARTRTALPRLLRFAAWPRGRAVAARELKRLCRGAPAALSTCRHAPGSEGGNAMVTVRNHAKERLEAGELALGSACARRARSTSGGS